MNKIKSSELAKKKYRQYIENYIRINIQSKKHVYGPPSYIGLW